MIIVNESINKGYKNQKGDENNNKGYERLKNLKKIIKKGSKGVIFTLLKISRSVNFFKEYKYYKQGV